MTLGRHNIIDNCWLLTHDTVALSRDFLIAASHSEIDRIVRSPDDVGIMLIRSKTEGCLLLWLSYVGIVRPSEGWKRGRVVCTVPRRNAPLNGTSIATSFHERSKARIRLDNINAQRNCPWLRPQRNREIPSSTERDEVCAMQFHAKRSCGSRKIYFEDSSCDAVESIGYRDSTEL